MDKIIIKIPEYQAKSIAGTIAMYLADEVPNQEDQLELRVFMRELAEAKPEIQF